MKTTPCNIVFLHTQETAQFLDLELFNPTCNNHLGEPFLFEFIKTPLKNHGINLELKKFHEIDKSKTWFVDLPMMPHKWHNVQNNTSKGLFDSIPEEIIKECIEGKAYLLFNNQNETDTIDIFRKFHAIYDRSPIVPTNKILLLSPSRLAEEVYFNWANETNIPKNKRIKIIYGSHIDIRFNEGDIQYWTTAPAVEKTKTFLSLNRVPRPHRIFLVAALVESGLYDKGNISLWYTGEKTSFMDEILTRKGLFEKSSKGKLLYDMIYSGMERIHQDLPFMLDYKTTEFNPAGFAHSNTKIYKESFINLTSTTFFFDWQEPSPGWNEKEWKPVLTQMPFILFGRYGALQSMKNFGILTFHKFIDESYDYMTDDHERFLAILEELKRLSSMSFQDLDKMLVEMNYVLEYNLEYTKSKRWEQVFYTSGLKEVLTYL
jgi:hypothetical protein